jgi:hypothetical protein
MEEWFKWKNLYKQEDLSLNPNPTKKKIKKAPQREQLKRQNCVSQA